MTRHAVALVPGFLGFDHIGRWTYWADRFLAALRGQIEARKPGTAPIPVVPVPTLPLGSLAARQNELIGHLRTLDAQEGGPYQWHLVGHSTGGLDAAFLTRKNPLVEGRKVSEFSSGSWTVALPAIASVTTISAPHHGTCLALSDVAELTERSPTLRGLLSGVTKLGETAVDVLVRPGGLSSSRIQFALGSAFEGSTLQFLRGLLFNDVLARDLDPSVAGRLTATENRTGTRILSIATVAPVPNVQRGLIPRVLGVAKNAMHVFERPAGEGPEDLLFRDLWTFTQEKAGEAPAAALVPKVPVVIASDPQLVPSAIRPRDNDGVVNTDRQFDGVPAGIVLADHGDVVGLYRRVDPLDRVLIEPGLLTSGANFGDDEFFKLMDLVATGIAAQIP